jgi:hypothetical protein
MAQVPSALDLCLGLKQDPRSSLLFDSSVTACSSEMVRHSQPSQAAHSKTATCEVNGNLGSVALVKELDGKGMSLRPP